MVYWKKHSEKEEWINFMEEWRAIIWKLFELHVDSAIIKYIVKTLIPYEGILLLLD